MYNYIVEMYCSLSKNRINQVMEGLPSGKPGAGKATARGTKVAAVCLQATRESSRLAEAVTGGVSSWAAKRRPRGCTRVWVLRNKAYQTSTTNY